LAYGTLFLAAFLEAVPVVGTFIPGSTIILSLSALIATGDLNLVVVFCSVISGAALGDGLAFGLGYRYPSRIRKFWPLNKHQVLVSRGETFFQKYGKAAVLFARFLPPVRAFVPVTAGAMGMTPRQFYPINLVAILLWAPVQVIPGMLAGDAYRHSGAIAGHLMLPIIAGVAGFTFLIGGFSDGLKLARWRAPGFPYN
jgi:membrane protein DedA with SNARE-associated domain